MFSTLSIAALDNSSARFKPSIRPLPILRKDMGSTSIPEPSEKISDGPPFFVTTGARPAAAASIGA